jgi:hypothetical protein
MRRRYIILVGLAALLALTATFSASHRSETGRTIAQEATVVPEDALNDEQPPIADPSDGQSLVTGLDAIEPRVAAAPGAPSFTAADVAAYLAKHPHSDADLSKAPPVIASIEFLTTQNLAARLGAAPDRPPEYLVCLVTLSGDFTVSGPEGGYTSSIGYQLFDAQTGNLLIEGVGE